MQLGTTHTHDVSRSWEGGSTRAWRRLRRDVLLRDGGVCQLKIPGVCTGVATHAHHTLGRARTGDDPLYVVAACEACNLKTGDPARAGDPRNVGVTKW